MSATSPEFVQWCDVASFLIEHKVLLLFLVLGIGTAFGNVRIRGISIGPAAVLFTALAFSAVSEQLALPEIVGTFGLAVFAYTVGLTAGPSFFASLRTGLRPVLMVFSALAGLGLVTWGIGSLLGLSPGLTAGLYAGSTTNTPGLAAATLRLGGNPEPTVAYGLTYAGGVTIMLAAAAWTLRRSPDAGTDAATEELRSLTIDVTRDNVLTVAELTFTPYGRVIFTRHQSAGDPVHVSSGDVVVRPGDRVLVIGVQRAINHVVKQLGQASEVNLAEHRHDVDFRRIILSQSRFYGRTIGQLNLLAKFDARATRVRRADHDFLATDGFVLQAGDRIRVAAPVDQMQAVSTYLGDSEHGASDINPLGLAAGMALGLLVGTAPLVVPGLGTVTLGHAAGPLVVGLVLGRLQRSGPVVWTLPHQSAQVLTQLGILLFLAYAGGRAGTAFVDALRSPLGLQLIAAGALVTGLHAGALLAASRWWLRSPGQRTAGYLAASQTQPAVLAFANAATRYDQRVALGYALVYPVAMITKIMVAQLLTLT